jgi:ribosomal protein S18 acetylase RimI-like enzyme
MVQCRKAENADLDALLELEKVSFSSDRLSRRSFRHWIKSEHGHLWVVDEGGEILGYGLLWCHKGTRLARLYSIAIAPEARGRGLAKSLLEQLEALALKDGRLFLRLEVAKGNPAAISLYESMGYRIFGEYQDYYDDHSDALRMQKQIRQHSHQAQRAKAAFEPVRWYQQTTDFTCGPASLMMAMSKVDENIQPNRSVELDMWREATTIFMTSGHGGCHPVGLALAAKKRGFDAQVYMNTEAPLFLDGVRSDEKKEVMQLVHEQFVAQAHEQSIPLVYADVQQEDISTWLDQGFGVLVLISTYRLDGKKAPHWVAIIEMDEDCFYVHDPDVADDQQPLDCQYLPIARSDFEQMSTFGVGRLRTAIAIRR